jgi:Ner family transcriptional regulator
MSKGMHKEDIKAAIRKRGKTMLQLSLENGLADATVRNALHRPIPTADRIIADFIGRSLHEIWPDRYNASGQRIKSSTLKTYNKGKNPVRHCKK